MAFSTRPAAANQPPAKSSDSRRLRTLRRLVVVFVVATFIVLGATAGVHLLQVHRFYGVWAWSPPGKTASIEYRGRQYLRGRPGTLTDLAGCIRAGTAPGDGQIFTRTPPPGAATTGIWIQYPDGTIIGYALSGGP